MNFERDMRRFRISQRPFYPEYSVGAEKDENRAILELRKNNILSYPSAKRTARVLSRLVRYGQYRLQAP